jgi:hypothetical protein
MLRQAGKGIRRAAMAIEVNRFHVRVPNFELRTTIFWARSAHVVETTGLSYHPLKRSYQLSVISTNPPFVICSSPSTIHRSLGWSRSPASPFAQFLLFPLQRFNASTLQRFNDLTITKRYQLKARLRRRSINYQLVK